MHAMHEIPPELADAELVALVLPFDEPVSSAHPTAPFRYGWGDIPLPRRELPLREVHDGRKIGLLSFFVLSRTGIWCRVKAGRTASALIAQGFTGISAEIDDGKLVGAALVGPGAEPAFASARLYGSAGVEDQEPQAALRFGLDPKSGVIAFRPPPPPSPVGRLRSTGVDLGAHRRELAGSSMAAVHAEVEDRRRRFRERREELAQQDLLDAEERLVLRGVPVALWPPHLPGRQRYDAFVAAQVAEDGASAAAEFADRMAHLEAAARAARPWYRRWFK